MTNLDELYNAVLASLKSKTVPGMRGSNIGLCNGDTIDVLVANEWIRIDPRSQLAAVIREGLA